MRLGRVVEFDDERMPLERGLHDPALNPPAPAVNQPDLFEARSVGGRHVRFDG